VTVEIAARFSESLAMTLKCVPCHCEQRSDEAISSFATGNCTGMTNIKNTCSPHEIGKTVISQGEFVVKLKKQSQFAVGLNWRKVLYER